MRTLIWAFPAIMASSIMIGWGAELTALRISAGLALAILALLQTLPEFGVEAFIAWSGNTHLMLANLTGSLRLFVGLGWPAVFFIYAIYTKMGWSSSKKKRTSGKAFPLLVQMPKTFCVEASFLFFPLAYFTYLAFKNRLNFLDGVVLCCLYLLYLVYLNYQRLYLKSEGIIELEEESHELDYVPRKILSFDKAVHVPFIMALFLFGGSLLLFSIHPFVDGLKDFAVSMGMSEFVFIQWVAPFASEFPEKVTAFGWARKQSKVPMAVFNMVSSSVNQWTFLAGFVPFVYSLSLGKMASIDFDSFQHTELLLTVAQSFLGFLFLSNLKFHWYEALGLFILWVVQLAVPSVREEIIFIYSGLILLEIIRLLIQGKLPSAWKQFFLLNRWIFRRFKRRGLTSA